MTWDGDGAEHGAPPRQRRRRDRGRAHDRDDADRHLDGGPWGSRRGGGSRRSPVATALVIAFAQVAGTHWVAQHGQSSRHPLDPLGYALLLLGPLLLVLRRRLPVAVCAGTAAVGAAYLIVGFPYGPVFLSVVVGFVGAVLTGHRRAAWVSYGVLYAVFLGVTIARDGFVWPSELALLAWLLLVVLVAEVIRTRTEHREQWRQARAEREQRIADEQRIAIARELHDVLAHSISLINVQAGVALELLDGDPEQARTALTTIKRTSKDALGEVRQVLGTLRAPGSAAPRTPAPGLERLDELVRQAAAAGLAVRLRTEGEPAALPQGVGLAAFRIVQEALTNIIRHSSARSADVVVAYAKGGLRVRVADPGPLSASGGPRAGGSGSGLAGMRERVAALGGSLAAGPQGEGFEVRAELPLRAPNTSDEPHPPRENR
ncbi:sensor histidine kinase [Streptacidiphilus sp. PB12-B1b]|uniref:sensor histidine kinase n=1 Tax=Streptacidiphilus sp. PB12-B1b TaxID=2705012 RepID=UPI0015FC54DD|nr:sensor histidine kinase [Streptacidiphilus sp. PB12-B1b]QMU77560.1 sensor histidine kinase [Streptacidiphilus sp. PB12-B1b]